ncbi:SAM-dependent methyltransferase [Streptomonospora nanhaiensis]|uniref:SAM-dependent methyltransferase n=1 Tax=Streptomonospora nanhaiensis TaxID=1323731 RepID=UPI001C991048|nr:SAM-dependent methyltransferase [Streptomonospora nanhaiensis]MBX9391861.1 SAM-dependent methyltransferase [Streptomonospora nanhaiensis]MBX9391949.1 SAM-dependent methyltransferase [Streptomonospora nanhaiensis]
MTDRVHPAGFTTTRATPARIYDTLLGGKDNYAVDREAARRILEREPNAQLIVKENRAFLRRVVSYLVGECGIRQIIDLGSGLPEQDNVHQVAQRIAPGTRVVYVDNDPIVLAHGRARLADNPDTAVVSADLRDADTVLHHPDTRALIDLTRPWALLAVAVFHFIPQQDPAHILDAYRALMPPGSCLALSHLSQDATTPEVAEEITRIYQDATAPLVLRSRAEIARLFAGMEMAEPGLDLIMRWRPPTPPIRPERVWLYGGVGRHPLPPGTGPARPGPASPAAGEAVCS